VLPPHVSDSPTHTHARSQARTQTTKQHRACRPHCHRYPAAVEPAGRTPAAHHEAQTHSDPQGHLRQPRSLTAPAVASDTLHTDDTCAKAVGRQSLRFQWYIRVSKGRRRCRTRKVIHNWLAHHWPHVQLTHRCSAYTRQATAQPRTVTAHALPHRHTDAQLPNHDDMTRYGTAGWRRHRRRRVQKRTWYGWYTLVVHSQQRCEVRQLQPRSSSAGVLF
jgi:hypothetical protein